MSSQSYQHKLDRVRRPRVQITYDVETNGAMQKIELPFVVGVVADLSGQPREALRPLKERKFVAIDRDNFNEVLEKATPRLALKVQNRLTDEDTKLAVELNFKDMEDFEPARVAEQVAPLKELLDMRQRLTQLLSKMEGNEKLEQLLADVLSNTEKAMALARQMGIEPSAAGAEAPKPEGTT
jgi:type VI secretion system protein ImpB